MCLELHELWLTNFHNLVTQTATIKICLFFVNLKHLYLGTKYKPILVFNCWERMSHWIPETMSRSYLSIGSRQFNVLLCVKLKLFLLGLMAASCNSCAIWSGKPAISASLRVLASDADQLAISDKLCKAVGQWTGCVDLCWLGTLCNFKQSCRAKILHRFLELTRLSYEFETFFV